MLTWIREKFGTIVILGLVVFVGFVFVFSGVFTTSPLTGLHEGSAAGTVNGEAISLGEFNRELNRRIEFFKSLAGGKITEQQLAAFRVREGVFQELVNRKLMTQAAEKMGMVPSDEAVRHQIREMEVFQKDGKFDPELYRQVLQANRLSPAGFEKMVREDLSLQRWSDYFASRVRVSEQEIRDEFLVTEDQRKLKYVLITPEAARKQLKITDKEVQTYLKDERNLNLAKSQYEAEKGTTYKGKKFEQVKLEIARDLVGARKDAEVQKLAQDLAQKVADKLVRQSEKQVNDFLKPYGLTVKKTESLPRKTQLIPGIGSVPELMKDAFADQSPIDPSRGGKAKVYPASGSWMAAVVSDVKKPDFAKLEKSRSQLRTQILERKERALYEKWLKRLVDGADIDQNDAVVGAQATA